MIRVLEIVIMCIISKFKISEHNNDYEDSVKLAAVNYSHLLQLNYALEKEVGANF